MNRRVRLAVLLAILLLALFALWPDSAASDQPVAASRIPASEFVALRSAGITASGNPPTIPALHQPRTPAPRSAPDNRMGDAAGRTLAGAAGAAQGRTEAPSSGAGQAAVLSPARDPSNGRESPRHRPAFRGAETAGGGASPSPSAAAQPVRSSGEPSGQSPSPAASVTGNSSAIPKGSIRGVASWMPERYGARYLALPEGAGVRVRVCGKSSCIVRVSNDAGPSLARQREGRIVDLSVQDFELVTGASWRRGLAWVTVERLR